MDKTTEVAAPGAAAEVVTMKRADLEALIVDVTAKAVRDEMKAKGSNHMGGLVDADRPITSGQKTADEGTGLRFVRMVKAKAVAALDGGDVDTVLRGWGYKHIADHAKQFVTQAKALGQSVFAEGGRMVPPEFSSEFIALLRNVTLIRRAGARSVPLNGTLDMGRQNSAGQAFYVGENAPVTPSEQRLGSIVLSEKQLIALTALSNMLIRNASQSAEQFVLEDLRNVMALREDLAFLFGTGAQETPRGLTSLLASANQYNATAVAPKAPTLAELRVEFAKAIGTLKKGNIPMLTPHWLMAPRTEQFLMGVTDGNGNAVFESQMEAGRLRGLPYLVSNQIPENLGNTAGTGSDFSRLMLVDTSQEVIGDGMQVEATVIPNGTYEEGGQTRSGVSRNQSVVRLVSTHDHNVRYDTCGVSIAVQWGAP
jgi:HK97 family phage major capsid protein